MSSARLEIIRDEPSIPPRLSRALPAALYGIVDASVFQAFCDKLDGLFDQLDSEQRRRKKRFWWMYGTIYIWFIFFCFFAPIAFGSYSSPVGAALVALCLCVIHIVTVLAFTARPAGVKTDTEVMREIRLECDDMTNRNPYVSFQVVLMPISTAARGAWLQMNTVDHIAVSIAASASTTGAATAVSAVMASASDGKADVVSENQEPVIYAKAVSHGGYQPCATGNDVEMV
jgi:hypothetical protein